MHLDRRFQELVGIELPILLAPMAGPGDAELAIAVAEAGGLGSLPCAMLSDDKIRADLGIIRQRTPSPINLNFFCHEPARFDAEREAAWQQAARALLCRARARSGRGAELGPRRSTPTLRVCRAAAAGSRQLPFRSARARCWRASRRPAPRCFRRQPPSAEARWLEQPAATPIIAQGFEAGGHRGMFLSDDIATQVGTMALVPQVVDAVTGAGDRGRRHLGCPRHRRGLRARRVGRADRHRLSALPGSQGAAGDRAALRCRPPTTRR